jgi:hypothetical protein
VAKVGPTLVPSWTKYVSFTSHQTNLVTESYAVAVDMAGHVYTTGSFAGTLDFDPGPGQYLLQSGNKGKAIDVYVWELDSAGNFVAVADMPGASSSGSRGLSIAVDNSSPGSPNVYTTGQLRGTVDFDPTSGTYDLTSNSSSVYPDIFVSKLTQPASPQLATRQASTPLNGSTGYGQASALLLGTESYTITDLATVGGSLAQPQGPLAALEVPETVLATPNLVQTPQQDLGEVPPMVGADWFFTDFEDALLVQQL